MDGSGKLIELVQEIETFKFKIYLLPANVVWGKVIFLHLSVILFTGGVRGQVHPWQAPPWQVHPSADGQCAGGTHPTGMHSCLFLKSHSRN